MSVRLLLISLATLALAGAFHAYARWGRESHLRELEAGRRLVREVNAFQTARKSDFKKTFYPDENPSDFVSSFLEEISRHKLKLVSLKPEEKATSRREGATFSGMAISLRIKGAWPDIYLFLKSLESGDYFLIEESMILEKLDEAQVDLAVKFILPLSEPGRSR